MGRTERRTLETSVAVEVDIDGEGKAEVDTGIRYLDHMLKTLARHSLIDMKIEAKGDLKHHIVEDISIALGETISKALGERDVIMRYSSATIPMDESLASASVDLVKRPYSVITLRIERDSVEDMLANDIRHFLQSFIQSLEATVHIRVEYGEDDHHKVEASFKALAVALRQAASIDPARRSPPSVKGVM